METCFNRTNKIVTTNMNYIKLNRQAAQRGTTLVELSVVIAVILLLVGVLFIGVTAWQNGANNAACLVNQATLQKAARGYANVNQVQALGAVPHANLVTAGFFTVLPTCPVGNTPYNYADINTAEGVEYAVCAAPAPGPHVPASTANW
jgi:type II secretory pathway pseudopilin PulG